MFYGINVIHKVSPPVYNNSGNNFKKCAYINCLNNSLLYSELPRASLIGEYFLINNCNDSFTVLGLNFLYFNNSKYLSSIEELVPRRLRICGHFYNILFLTSIRIEEFTLAISR